MGSVHAGLRGLRGLVLVPIGEPCEVRAGQRRDLKVGYSRSAIVLAASAARFAGVAAGLP